MSSTADALGAKEKPCWMNYTEPADETLRPVITPREAAAVHAPKDTRLLLGLEPPVGHAVTGDEPERMLRGGTLPPDKRSRETQKRKDMFTSSHTHRYLIP